MARYTIILQNNATKKYVLITMNDTSATPRFYRFNLRSYYSAIVEAIGTGEGEYYVCPAGTSGLSGATILDRGVMQIGAITPEENTTYISNRTYEQYENQ